MRPDLKRRLIQQARTESGQVFTDPLASPTGFPFKVAQLATLVVFLLLGIVAFRKFHPEVE